ncbi:hypothetical protein BH23GEM7_BH23GEM7_11990 [soil metagenome]|nr:hypothetical protein [Gemmatimonadota bacterium]
MAKDDVPKIIHFIWVGGTLKHSQLYWIAEWARKNTGYQTWVWYDTRHLLANVLRKKVASNPNLRQHTTADQYLGGDKGRRQFLSRYNIMEVDEAKEKKRELKSAWNDEATQILSKYSNISLKNVKTDLGGMTSQHLYDMELNDWGGNMAGASDVLRVELLVQFGGVYLDIDLECIKPFPTFRVRRDLALFGNWQAADGGPRLNNAIIASAPGSAILQEYRDHQANFFTAMENGSVTQYLSGLFNNFDSRSLPNWVRTNPSFTAGVGPGWLHDETLSGNKSRRELAILRSTGPGAALTVAGQHFVQSAQRGQRSFEEEFLFPQGYVNFDTPAQRVSSTRNADL